MQVKFLIFLEILRIFVNTFTMFEIVSLFCTDFLAVNPLTKRLNTFSALQNFTLCLLKKKKIHLKIRKKRIELPLDPILSFVFPGFSL